MNSMKPVENIWEPLPDNICNRDKSRIYFERAKVVFLNIANSGVACPGARGETLLREYVAQKIGCSRSVLTQNSKIRELLEAADRRVAQAALFPESGPCLPCELELFTPQGHANVLHVGALFSLIVNTSEEFKSAGISFAVVPTILFSDGVHEEGSDWLRQLVVDKKVMPSSAGTYATALRYYLKFCRRKPLDWRLADDRTLMEFHEVLLKGREIGTRYINDTLSAVFRFYVYCEQSKILRLRVGCYERASLAEHLQDVKFPITAVPAVSGGDYTKTLGWRSPLFHVNVPSSIGNRATPRNDDMEAAHREALKKANGIRDTTILRFAEDMGGRRAEILQIRVNQIPSLEEIDDLAEDEDGWWPIEVLRKGNRREVLRAQPDTLYAVHAYLRERSAVVKQMKGKPGYKEPGELFISGTEGTPLRADSITKIFSAIFKRIGLMDATLHRVRAKFAVDTVETVLDAFLDLGIEFSPGSSWVETVLQQVAIRMGHKDPSSLKHYLTVALERRVRISYAAAEKTQAKIDRNTRVEMAAMYRKAKFATQLLADMDVRAGYAEQAARLRAHAAELESRESVLSKG